MNLSAPREPNVRQNGSWSAASTLTQNRPDGRIWAYVRELIIAKYAIRGGSIDTEVNDPTTMPSGGARLVEGGDDADTGWVVA